MSKYIPVDPEKWAAMVKAQSDLVRYKEMCDELDAECSRLKAEVKRLTKAGDELIHGLAPGGSEYSMTENIERWLAAKEGKQP